MSNINWPDDSAFAPFDVFEETYKTISSHDIIAAVLIPRGLKQAVHPVIVNIHGGFFATGHSLFAPFFSPWLLKLAIDHGAIIISADYRLLPTPNGIADQLEDLEDFWQWSRAELPSVLERHAPGQLLDYSKVLLAGGSAGGYYTTQLALSHPNEVSVLALAYPAVDLKDDVFVHGPPVGAPTVLCFPAEQIPSKEDALVWVEKRRKTVASKGGFEITPFPVALTQHGILTSQMLEYDGVKLATEHLPLERIRAGATLPKAVWIIHGDDDSVVYLRQSEAFVDLIKKEIPTTAVRFDVAAGHDHAFDFEPSFWEPFAAPAMDFVTKGWLG
ncbi:hypothetical protein LTR85_006235 [Meristemomyces frigidus]|nr:hypothetical protein LTR85_006235 [Meristemomyces frigidus]